MFRFHFQVVDGVKGGCKRYRQTAEGLKDSEEDRKDPSISQKRFRLESASRLVRWDSFRSDLINARCDLGEGTMFDIERSVLGGLDFLLFACSSMLPSGDEIAGSRHPSNEPTSSGGPDRGKIRGCTRHLTTLLPG